MKPLPEQFFICVPREDMNLPIQNRLKSLGFQWRGGEETTPWRYCESHKIFYNYNRHTTDQKLSFGSGAGRGTEVTLDDLNLYFAAQS